ncbi:hypothetical protein GE115_12590 [Agromyces sp. CFH 90414]|uniref:Uncharacterized protein n=1 Tax=Agromyces agglutinans TaxID=2662258 RepID=A0A6I2FDF1_9MICO|nr:hypothetical protein [Agromyces agglutinans]MRG60700.1 hypothetical protein [Agromyces agglutinans]
MTNSAATTSIDLTRPTVSQRAGIGARPAHLTSPDLVSENRYGSNVPTEVINAVESYAPKAPKSDWQRIAPFAQEIAAHSSDNATDAARMMRVLSPFLVWCVTEQGLPMDAEALLTPRVIDAYISGLELTDGSRGTYRSKLTTAAERVNPSGFQKRMEPIKRRQIAPPYAAEEMIAFEFWASGQATELKRRKARLMLALGAGAGVRPGEFDLLCRDVTVDGHGVVVTVGTGGARREVPVLSRWEPWITAELAKLPEEGPLWMTEGQKSNKRLLNGFTERTSGTAPNGLRLRTTWIVTHLAAGTPIKELMRAAGMAQFNNLDRYLAFVDDVGPTAYRNALRGSAQR